MSGKNITTREFLSTLVKGALATKAGLLLYACSRKCELPGVHNYNGTITLTQEHLDSGLGELLQCDYPDRCFVDEDVRLELFKMLSQIRVKVKGDGFELITDDYTQKDPEGIIISGKDSPHYYDGKVDLVSYYNSEGVNVVWSRYPHPKDSSQHDSGEVQEVRNLAARAGQFWYDLVVDKACENIKIKNN